MESRLGPEEARRALRSSTAGFWAREAFSEQCVGVLAGRLFFAWLNPWRRFAFVSGPVFRGTVSPTPSGSVLSGRFTVPVLNVAFALCCLAFVVCCAAAIFVEFRTDPRHLALATLVGLLVCAPVLLIARWIVALPWVFEERDQLTIESLLTDSLTPPAT